MVTGRGIVVTWRTLSAAVVGALACYGAIALVQAQQGTSAPSFTAADRLEIHPEDARRDGIADGAALELESRWGATRVSARITPRVARGTLFLSFHHPETHANRVTGPSRDPESDCPQYKATAVRLRKV